MHRRRSAQPFDVRTIEADILHPPTTSAWIGQSRDCTEAFMCLRAGFNQQRWQPSKPVILAYGAFEEAEAPTWKAAANRSDGADKYVFGDLTRGIVAGAHRLVTDAARELKREADMRQGKAVECDLCCCRAHCRRPASAANAGTTSDGASRRHSMTGAAASSAAPAGGSNGSTENHAASATDDGVLSTVAVSSTRAVTSTKTVRPDQLIPVESNGPLDLTRPVACDECWAALHQWWRVRMCACTHVRMYACVHVRICACVQSAVP